MDHATGTHRGFGFIEFEAPEDAAAAMDNMHNSGGWVGWVAGLGSRWCAVCGSVVCWVVAEHGSSAAACWVAAAVRALCTRVLCR